MSAKALVGNGDLLVRDYGFQAGITAIIEEGVQKNIFNECEVTTNQVDTGLVFLEAIRTSVSPNETFLIPILITAPITVDTSGTGYVIVRLDNTKLNAENAGADGTDLVVVEAVTSLPSSNYVILATLSGGSITDARTYSELSEYILPAIMHYDEDTAINDTYVVTINGIKAYVDGLEIVMKVNTANTGAATCNVNGFGAKAIKKKYNDDLDTGDFEAGQIVVLRYDADNDYFQLMSFPASIQSLVLATQSEAEAGTNNSAYMSALRSKESFQYNMGFTATAGETLTVSGNPLPVYVSTGEGSRTAGRVYRCDANDTIKEARICWGFVDTTTSSGSTAKVKRGKVAGFTSLTPGVQYYVSDTVGVISATAGTYEVPVGMALSATEIDMSLSEGGMIYFDSDTNITAPAKGGTTTSTSHDKARMAIVTERNERAHVVLHRRGANDVAWVEKETNSSNSQLGFDVAWASNTLTITNRSQVSTAEDIANLDVFYYR